MAAKKHSSVLVIGGLDSLVRQIASLPGTEHIRVMASDPEIFPALAKIPHAWEQLAFNDPKVTIISEDAVTWLPKQPRSFDVIIMALPPPATLAGNRFYTTGFFRLLANRLREGGAAAVVLPGSESVPAPPLAALSASVLAALGASFPATVAVPGDQLLLLASDQPLKERLTPEVITTHITANGVQPLTVTREYLEDRLSPMRSAQLYEQLAATNAAANREVFPHAVRHSVQLQLDQQGHGGQWTALFNRNILIIPLAVVLALVVTQYRMARARQHISWFATMAGSGFTAMALQIVLLLAWQSRTGLIYQGVALFTALFMCGTATGAIACFRAPGHCSLRTLVVAAETGLMLIALSLTLLFIAEPGRDLTWLLCGGVTLTGICIGVEFHAIQAITASSGRTRTGAVYAMDLAGACLGGVISAVMLIPLTGFAATCALLAILKAIQCTLTGIIRKDGICSEALP